MKKKFRVWVNDRMVYQTGALASTERFFRVTSYSGKAIIMLYSNLHDKNGKEIYDGDILENVLPNGTKKLYKIWFGKGGFVMNYFQSDFYKLEEEIVSWEALADHQNLIFVSSSLSVIGNIYETPKLIIANK